MPLLLSFQKGELIIFKKTFQRVCTRIFFPNIIFEMSSNPHCAHLLNLTQAQVQLLNFLFTLWSYHFITSNIFSSTFHLMLCLPHSIGHGLAQCICGYHIDLIKIHLLQYSHRGNHSSTHETKTFCFMGNIVLSPMETWNTTF
jgi:hypothetical protein